MITIILFIVVIAVLIFVHELGHFLAARLFGIRVEEFCVGFPPKIWQKKGGDTNYAIGIIPIGGYVKIVGEDGEGIQEGNPIPSDNMLSKSKPVQVAVLLAGVVFNLIFAWIIFSISFIVGIPTLTGYSPVGSMSLEGNNTTVVYIQNKMPASEAGIKVGDVIESIKINGDVVLSGEIQTEELSNLLKEKRPQSVTFNLGGEKEITVNPIVSESDSIPRLGLSIAPLAIAKSPWYLAPFHAAWYTLVSVKEISFGLFNFIKNIFIGTASLDGVAGPIGIASMVEQASRVGFGSLFSFIAVISIHLSVINSIPIPALDGGRVLFILIEWIRRKPIKQSVAVAVNATSMILLLILMVVITISDFARLF